MKIIIAGGGTGGHLFPGIALAETLKKQRPQSQIYFVGTQRGLETKIIPQHGYQLLTLPIAGMYRVGYLKLITSLLKFPFALLKSFYYLIKIRPALVIGVGGYASGPFLLMAIFLRKAVIIQEQNAFPGLTNRILGKFVPLSFIPFATNQKLFRNPIIVGNPVRKAVQDIRQNPIDRRPENPFHITIFGGSQGSHIINQIMISSLFFLQDLADQITILHQTGVNDYQWVCDQYANFNFQATILSFIDDMAAAYAKSHLLISRAGSSINEIIAAGRASILIPITHTSGNHQLNNALTLKKAKAAMMIEEKDLTPELFAAQIKMIVHDQSLRKSMEEHTASLYHGDAATNIIDKTLQYFNL